MPLGAPIGSNKGLATRDFIQILIDEMDLPVIVDAGIGRPSQACEAMEMGAAAIMGQHRPGHRRGPAPDGRRLPPGHRGRPEGLPLRPGPGAGPGGPLPLTPSRAFSTIKGAGRPWKTEFFVDSQALSPAALEREAPAGAGPHRPQVPHGVPARDGGAGLRPERPRPSGDGRL